MAAAHDNPGSPLLVMFAPLADGDGARSAGSVVVDTGEADRVVAENLEQDLVDGRPVVAGPVLDVREEEDRVRLGVAVAEVAVDVVVLHRSVELVDVDAQWHDGGDADAADQAGDVVETAGCGRDVENGNGHCNSFRCRLGGCPSRKLRACRFLLKLHKMNRRPALCVKRLFILCLSASQCASEP